MLIAGDLSWDGVPASTIHRRRPPWSALAEVLAGHDLRLADLEAPLTTRDSRIAKAGPHLHGDPVFAAVTRQGGFDVACLANNHILDMGPQGLADTLAACGDAGLLTVGAGMNAEQAGQPLIVERAGLRLGIAAFAEHEFSYATRTSAGANPLDPLEAALHLAALRAECDAVLVLLHAGTEHFELPSPALVATCRGLIDAGAHAVVCTHSHVASGVEMHRGQPIFYGTGNFLFHRPDLASVSWCSGYLVSLAMSANGVREASLIPYWQSRSSPAVEAMDPGEMLAFSRHLKGLSATISRPAELDSAWQMLCVARRSYYLSRALGLSRLERRLARLGVWPFWRMRRRRVAAWLNVIECESHAEAMKTILRGELRQESRSGR